jgi:hypothetical protein
VLYREYMAFAPWNLEKPQGPVDPPKLLELPPTPTYWINQAKRCWKVCQEFTELLYESKKENALVENPIVAFATYTVGWCGKWPPGLSTIIADRPSDLLLLLSKHGSRQQFTSPITTNMRMGRCQ